MDNGCDHLFEKGFECCVNSLVPQSTNHKTHTMVSGARQPWCYPFAMEHHQHSIKGWETPVHEQQEEGQRDNEVKCVALLPS